MASEHQSNVQISTGLDGAFEDIVLRESALARHVQDGASPWQSPILLYGQDVDAEIDTLKRGCPAIPWLLVRNFRDFAGARRGEFSEMELRVDPRFYEQLTHDARGRLTRLLRGEDKLAELIEFVAVGPSGEGYLGRTDIGRRFIDWVELLSNTAGMVLPWQMKNSFLPAVVLAVWSLKPRLYPLILHSPKRFGVPSGTGIEVASGGISFEALVAETKRVFGLSAADVEKGYRVWQLSRTGDTTKPHATTPKSLTQEVAREFLGVLTRARTEKQVAEVAPQRPAPLMFELEDGAVGLKHVVSAPDSPAVTKAAASSLLRRVERLQQDAYFFNVVPSAKDMLGVVADILRKFLSDDYTDADAVELGLELNALQWHVDPLREQLGDVSIGELTGLLATASIFLNRFEAWRDYTGTALGSGRPEDGVAAFSISYELLESARGKASFLTSEANARIASVLERTEADSVAPPLREGLIRSGENLAAVTTAGLSNVVVAEARQLAGAVKTKGYEEASSAIVAYAVKNASMLLRLGELRQAPWLSWLQNWFS